ncbi:pyridoxal phosphate-dependent decarboxylase family protein [Pseudoteredinibacter isoporae]|uniref:Glutamate/tyrosine decarboxylase-like PLP-dependent enzyme n=1 Tax=Pseudoteredinibacter isoporae TaxID=570281 RepID=A0A7X0JRQ6_9GAMM|nr:aminotransferase class I/II-fold pyridoxal phosphate-dependent enzyme [Pseudoteredinibacter isoporae]MBB6521067.1 glutamate/tyrosine decarboxylase-like PLP-dependent enzyme [Pseudoteredinibacter isoporae]NHO86631.1 aminotransferase class I/II-fold pyridoxal phosphate-dependent enzyme [Pseudoteredinibacter isoporae]NIB24917.1 aminotransferase class I/II-fold pyridoxal phosphate-dependent enzyme [Pseudoteredinibacter isoporae]
MVLEVKSLGLLEESLEVLEQSFQGMPAFEAKALGDRERDILLQVAERMQDNYPYPHPLYAGQMLKPPHPIARLAYMLSMWVNPNNHALDGGRASSALEKEAVAEIAEMFGWDKFLGHLTGGGTMANMEALWVSGRLHPGKRILASSMAHYTHGRISEVLQLPFTAVAADDQARMDMAALENELKKGDVGTVVVTLGTTGVGSVDPLHKVLELKKLYDFRVHVDSAYGGYFGLVDNLDDNAAIAYSKLDQVDSIVIDPHKHGLQPYGCGCILFSDASVGRFYKHDSPYTYFSSDDMHLGEITLECSRAGASAVALWATQKLLPLNRGGEFANGLADGRKAALELHKQLQDDPKYKTTFEPELDILIWAPDAKTTQEISQKSQALFDLAEKNHLHLALLELPLNLAKACWGDSVEYNSETVSCLRSTLMKPEHLEWIADIKRIMDESLAEI